MPVRLSWVSRLSLTVKRWILMVYSALALEAGSHTAMRCLPCCSSLAIFGTVLVRSLEDVFAGVDPDLSPQQVEWGFYQKVGDLSTKK